MHCRFCGERVGMRTAHDCQSEREPENPASSTLLMSYQPPYPGAVPAGSLRLLTILSGALIVDRVLATALVVRHLVREYQLYRVAKGYGVEVSAHDVAAVVARQPTVRGYQLVALLLAVGYIAVYLVWLATARRLAGSLGDRGTPVLAHWSYRAWPACAVILLLVILGTGGVPAYPPGSAADAMARVANSIDRLVLLDAGWICVSGLLVVMVAVVLSRMRVASREVPQSGVVPTA